jgi:hemerythrin-like domain-containing protein
MHFQRQVSRTLHGEHLNMMGLLGRLEHALSRAPRYDPALAGLLGQFARALEEDVDRHFRFEEGSLFPRMADNGDGDMAALLAEEHEAIREVAAELLPLARAAGTGAIDEPGWAALRVSAMELIERQVAHIQKETMALLPLLDDLLDEESDRDLAFAYASA